MTSTRKAQLPVSTMVHVGVQAFNGRKRNSHCATSRHAASRGHCRGKYGYTYTWDALSFVKTVYRLHISQATMMSEERRNINLQYSPLLLPRAVWKEWNGKERRQDATSVESRRSKQISLSKAATREQREEILKKQMQRISDIRLFSSAPPEAGNCLRQLQHTQLARSVRSAPLAPSTSRVLHRELYGAAHMQCPARKATPRRDPCVLRTWQRRSGKPHK